jgi:Prokaryotic lipoprotein-attachment site
MKQFLTLTLVLALAAGLSACGRKADPRLASGVTDTFPSSYPAGAPRKYDNIFRIPGPD